MLKKIKDSKTRERHLSWFVQISSLRLQWSEVERKNNYDIKMQITFNDDFMSIHITLLTTQRENLSMSTYLSIVYILMGSTNFLYMYLSWRIPSFMVF